METPTEPTVCKRREYYREYQHKRYHSDLSKARGYKQSLRLKKNLDLGETMWEKYRHHLNDVVKFTTLARRLPRQFVLEIIENLPTEEEPAEEPTEEPAEV